MEIDLAAIISTLGLAGIIALIGWAWRMNGRMTVLEGDVKHGFRLGSKTMKRHTDKLSLHDDEIRALELTAAENRGRGGSNPSMRPFRE